MVLVTWLILPFMIFYVFATTRDFSSRKEFMHAKQLEKVIEELLEENEIHETALQSAVCDRLFDELKANKFSSLEVVDEAFVVFVDITYSFAQSREVDTIYKFKKLSEINKELEEIVKSYDLEVVKTSGNRLIVITRVISSEGTDDKRGKTLEQITKFTFKVVSLLSQKNQSSQNMTIECKIVIDFGRIEFGLLGTKEFVYDCYGMPVSRSKVIQQSAKNSEIIVTEIVASMLGNTANAEVVLRDTIETRHLGAFNTYYLQEKNDILGYFIGNIEWMGGEREREPIQQGDDVTIIKS